MCSAAAYVGAASGGLTFMGQAAQARAQHQAAQAAAQRQNIINEQAYQNKLQIAIRKDQDKSDIFSRKLAALAESQTAYARQRMMNQMEATRASISGQTALKEKITEMSFAGQSNLAKAIQARGSVLAGQQPGQSMLLSLQNIERVLGQETAQLNAQLFDANRARYAQQYGIDLDRYTADVMARTRIAPTPVAQSAEFAPQRLPEVQGPTGDALKGGLLAAAGSGVSSFVRSATAADKDTWNAILGRG